MSVGDKTPAGYCWAFVCAFFVIDVDGERKTACICIILPTTGCVLAVRCRAPTLLSNNTLGGKYYSSARRIVCGASRGQQAKVRANISCSQNPSQKRPRGTVFVRMATATAVPHMTGKTAAATCGHFSHLLPVTPVVLQIRESVLPAAPADEPAQNFLRGEPGPFSCCAQQQH